MMLLGAFRWPGARPSSTPRFARGSAPGRSAPATPPVTPAATTPRKITLRAAPTTRRLAGAFNPMSGLADATALARSAVDKNVFNRKSRPTSPRRGATLPRRGTRIYRCSPISGVHELSAKLPLAAAQLALHCSIANLDRISTESNVTGGPRPDKSNIGDAIMALFGAPGRANRRRCPSPIAAALARSTRLSIAFNA